MLFKTTLYKKTFVLTLNERSGTVLLLDVLTQLRGVEASRVDTDQDVENNGITLQGDTEDLGNPNISFGRSSGPAEVEDHRNYREVREEIRDNTAEDSDVIIDDGDFDDNKDNDIALGECTCNVHSESSDSDSTERNWDIPNSIRNFSSLISLVTPSLTPLVTQKMTHQERLTPRSAIVQSSNHRRTLEEELEEAKGFRRK